MNQAEMDLTQQDNLKVLDKWNISAEQAREFTKLFKGSDKDWDEELSLDSWSEDQPL